MTAFARDVFADADTMCFFLNAPDHHCCAEEFPPPQRVGPAFAGERAQSRSSSTPTPSSTHPRR